MQHSACDCSESFLGLLHCVSVVDDDFDHLSVRVAGGEE